jgi:hypothetical protein
LVVPSSELLAPEVAVGAPLEVSGGHALAHSPVHALVLPESCVNRYSVRPCESTRIVPSALLAVPTLVGGVDAFGVVDAVAPPPPPPHAATASGASAAAAVLARIAIDLDGWVMVLLCVGGRVASAPATSDGRLTFTS